MNKLALHVLPVWGYPMTLLREWIQITQEAICITNTIWLDWSNFEHVVEVVWKILWHDKSFYKGMSLETESSWRLWKVISEISEAFAIQLWKNNEVIVTEIENKIITNPWEYGHSSDSKLIFRYDYINN